MFLHLLAAPPRLLGFLLLGLLASGLPAGTAADTEGPPPDWDLGVNVPEPFCPDLGTTVIQIGVAEGTHVELVVWNPPMTAVLRVLIDGLLSPGYYQVAWDGLPEGSQNPVPEGVYPYRMVAYYEGEPENPLFDETKTMTIHCEPTPTQPETWARLKALFR